jgi:hypothetical protein
MIDMGRTATARDPIARLGRHSLHHPIDQRRAADSRSNALRQTPPSASP